MISPAAAAAPTITFTIVNSSLTPPQPVLFVGQPANLDVCITNATGGALGLQAGPAASTLDLYLPAWQLAPDIAALCQGIALAGWTAAPHPTVATALRLTFGGAGPSTTWAAGSALAFSLAGVSSQAAATTGSFALVPTNVAGSNVPDEITAPFTLQPAPPAGAVSLAGLLAAELDNQGILYVSDNAATPLVNTLQLNLKNTRIAADGTPLPLYSGLTPWADLHPAPQPQVTAWFVYAADSGGLAPDAPQAPDSAWHITLALAQDQTGGWTPSGPVAATGTAPHGAPQWLLQPAVANVALLGVGDDTNLTVAFHNIVSVTPAGHTQLYLAFTGFWQNETTAYEPLFLTLDIKKETAPLPQVFSFDAPQVGAQMTLPFNQPGQPLAVQFAWSLTGVARIELAATKAVAMQPYSKSYTADGGMVYDTTIVSFPLPNNFTSENVTFTLTAYDANNKVISNDHQLTFYLENQLFFDAAGQAYPTAQLGNQLWLARNLDYDAGPGSVYYNNDPGQATPYGRLYTLGAAQQHVPAGWRLPTIDDFNHLLDNSRPHQFQALIAGGGSGFAGQLGGFAWIPDGQTAWGFYEEGGNGYYWSSSVAETPDKVLMTNCLVFSPESPGSVSVLNASKASEVFGYAVRYVRDVGPTGRPRRS